MFSHSHSKYVSCASCSSGRSSGFALVIALSLMSFLILLILAISALIQVESTTARIGIGQLQARMNAQLSAMIAFGDLQRYAGPDQRVSARSDILLPPDAEPLLGQGQWTGIWSSQAPDSGKTEDAEDGLEGWQARWLVSGYFDPVDSDAPLPDPSVGVDLLHSVQLASVGSSVVTDQQTVRVPIVDIPSAASYRDGQYAYWVSDEGIKARINLEDPYAGSVDDEKKYYRSAIAQQSDATTVSNSRGLQPFATGPGGTSLWKENIFPLANLTTSDSLSLLPVATTTDPVNLDFFHDFTTHSRSVLANVKDGGLRRDLSTALRDLPRDLRGPIFPPVGGVASPGNPGGPKWEQLADYFDLADSGSLGGSSIAFRQPTSDQVGFAPVITRFNFIIQAFAEKLPNASANNYVSDYSFTLGIFPLITLWNPYARDMVLPDLGLQADMRGIKLMNKPKNGTQIGSNLISPRHFSEQNRQMLGFTIASTTIPAGGAINFTPPNNSYLSTNLAQRNVLKPGASSQLVRGFFTSPVVISGNNSPMFSGNGSVEISMSSQNPQLWEQIVNLYGSPDMEPEERFVTLTIDGFGDIYRNHNWHSPRVILFSDMYGSNGNPIQPVGSSQSAEWVEFTDFDLEEIDRFAHNVTGSAAILKLPRSAVHNRVDHAIQILSQMNPRAPMAFKQMHRRAQSSSDPILSFRLYGKGEYDWWESNNTRSFLAGTDGLNASIGLGNDFSTNGSDKMVLFDVPDQAPLSIGQFMHANLMNIDNVSHTFTGQGKGWYSNLQQPHTTPTYAIGNSAANIHLPLEQTRLNITNRAPFLNGFHSINGSINKWKGAHYDYSYELNDALWDAFFLSSVDPDNLEFPLPNARMVPWDEDFIEEKLEEEERAAAHLVLEGGFNINSTSVAAWESVLGALRDVATLGELPSDPSLQVHNLSRFIAPVLRSTPSPETINYRSDKDSIVAGFRALTDEQISNLSEQVVQEVQRRSSARGHPFRTLSEFINRSIDPVDTGSTSRRRFAYNGALQFAIDQSNINGTPALNKKGEPQSGDGLWGDSSYLFKKSSQGTGPYYSDAIESVESRPLIEGAPGFLTQADILAKIGPLLNARSDTFTVRGYGAASRGFYQDAETSAYCELVLQRTPAYIDPRDLDHEPATTQLNRQFGRRFELISFRWLEEDEI